MKKQEIQFRILARKDSITHEKHTVVAFTNPNKNDPDKPFWVECCHKYDLGQLWEKAFSTEEEAMAEFIAAV